MSTNYKIVQLNFSIRILMRIFSSILQKEPKDKNKKDKIKVIKHIKHMNKT